MYDDVTAAASVLKPQQRDEMETCTDDAITEAMTGPPETITWARLRGAFVKRAKERRRRLHGGLGPPS